MPPEPAVKRAVAFFDGQNLFHSAKSAFAATYPDYDPMLLAKHVCGQRGWQLDQVRFYTGIPDPTDQAFWNHFWSAKLLQLSRAGAHVYSRKLRYRNKKVKLPGGRIHSYLAGEEKGIDVRIAVDIIRLAHRNLFDVALVFSQDQDLSEVADEVRLIAGEQSRWIKMVTAFPDSPASHNHRGVNGTDWIRIDRATYQACLDSHDHRPPTKTTP